ncbi:MAG: hypothetical protein OXG04_30100 [Acidobacteria bacterium]|nr:hypothetical protein [Acidobacteriota bacterium]
MLATALLLLGQGFAVLLQIGEVRTEVAAVRTEVAAVQDEISDMRTDIAAIGVQQAMPVPPRPQ